MKTDVAIAQIDSMRIAPRRVTQLRSMRANGPSTRYVSPPNCSNPKCPGIGLCYLCCADASSPGLVPDDVANEAQKEARAIVRASARNARRDGKSPDRATIIVRKTDGSTRVLQTARDATREAKRASRAAQTPRDAAEHRRVMSAPEIGRRALDEPKEAPPVARADGAAEAAAEAARIRGELAALAAATPAGRPYSPRRDSAPRPMRRGKVLDV